MRALICSLLLVVVAGCVYQPVGKFHRISDGQPADANPTILAAFMQDKAICDGEAAKAGLVSNEPDRYTHSRNINLVYDGCLAQRGYVRR
ncbi:hypothetical protein [Rhizobium sp. PL01]|uniref:hypothetical protein n=1 Tax=Rhizobium sp. PL01 TaxID=3085631 RepID=UPI002981E444|nr:hypothetical protein [Rhizobium sp. PL01]MDW5313763.1 hypothetical protein [Rhizobium sp. PL01]